MDAKHLPKELDSIHIGHAIRTELLRQERTVTWLAQKLNCDRRNVYNIFSRRFIDTELLFRICQILHTDFFACFSQALQAPNIQQNTPSPHITRKKPHRPRLLTPSLIRAEV